MWISALCDERERLTGHDRLVVLVDDGRTPARLAVVLSVNKGPRGVRGSLLHGLRHAAGSILARTADPVFVRDYLGHAKLTTTDRYVSAKHRPEDLARLNRAFAGTPAVDVAESSA